MKIAFLAGKTSIHTTRWVNALAAKGHNVLLFTQHKGGDNVIEGVKVCYLPFKGQAGYFLNARFLIKELKKNQPDILNAHYASGYGTLARLVKFSPYLLNVWGSDVYEFPDKNRWTHNLICKNILAADKIASTSSIMAKRVKDICPAIKDDISITPFGVDMDDFFPTLNNDSKLITIGTVKRFEKKYGIDTLIDGFFNLYQHYLTTNKNLALNLRLLLVGGGSQQAKLEQQVAKLNIENLVTFVDAIPHNKVPFFLNQMDIFVAVSRYDSESFGVAAIEANACELPVIVSDVDGFKEVIINNRTGIIIPRENPEILCEKLIFLIENPKLTNQLAKEGKEYVRATYSWDVCIENMEKLYKTVIKKHK